MYMHCYAHNLNLALVDCVKGNAHASEFFALVQALYVFLPSNKAHNIYIQKQKSQYPHNNYYKDLLIHVGRVPIMRLMPYAIHLTQSLQLWKTLVMRTTRIDELFQVFILIDYI